MKKSLSGPRSNANNCVSFTKRDRISEKWVTRAFPQFAGYPQIVISRKIICLDSEQPA